MAKGEMIPIASERTSQEILAKMQGIDDLKASNETILFNSASTDKTISTVNNKVDSLPSKIIQDMSGLSGAITFTSNGKFTVPKGVTRVRLTGCGAGGTYFAGDYCIDEDIQVTPEETIDIEVGDSDTKFGTLKTLTHANCSVSLVNSRLGYTTGYDGGNGSIGVHSAYIHGGKEGSGGSGGIGGAFGYGGGGGGGGGGAGYRANGKYLVGGGGGSGGGAASSQGNGSNSNGWNKPGEGYGAGNEGSAASGDYGGQGGKGGMSITSKGYGSGQGVCGSNGTLGSASGTYTGREGFEEITTEVIQGHCGYGGSGGAGGNSQGFLLVEWG